MKNRLALVRLFFIMFSLFVFTTFLSETWAQNENAEQAKDQADAKEFTDKQRKNLVEKYSKESIREVTSFEKNGLHGGKIKSLYINGEIKPTTSVISIKKEHGKAREIATGFLIEKSNDVFDVSDINDLREFKVKISKDATGEHNFTHLYFNRYVGNLRLDGSYIHITVKDDDNISSVSADVAPVSKELLKAVKSKTLSEEDIKKIVEDDLQTDASSSDTPKYVVDMISKDKEYPRFKKIEKLAIPVSPYVIWKVDSIWIYSIDAFTGQILKKLPTIIID